MGITATSQRLYVGAKTDIWGLDNFLRDDELDSDLTGHRPGANC